MNIEKLLDQIEAKKARKSKIESYLECGNREVATLKISRKDSLGRTTRTLEDIKIPIEKVRDLINKEVAELDAFLNKYEPMIEMFNSALKGVSNE